VFCDTADALGHLFYGTLRFISTLRLVPENTFKVTFKTVGRRPTVWKLAHDKVGLLKDREAVDRVDGVLLHAAPAAPSVTGRFVTSSSGRTKKAGRACMQQTRPITHGTCTQQKHPTISVFKLSGAKGGRARLHGDLVRLVAEVQVKDHFPAVRMALRVELRRKKGRTKTQSAPARRHRQTRPAPVGRGARLPGPHPLIVRVQPPDDLQREAEKSTHARASQHDALGDKTEHARAAAITESGLQGAGGGVGGVPVTAARAS